MSLVLVIDSYRALELSLNPVFKVDKDLDTTTLAFSLALANPSLVTSLVLFTLS